MLQIIKEPVTPGVFKKITYMKDIGSTPARVNRRTRELLINMKIWPGLKPEHKRFVLLHEEGHVVLNTSNEEAVDDYAFKKYAAEGHSLTESVKALTHLLKEGNPQHVKRAALQLNRAKRYDYFVNKNLSCSPGYQEMGHTHQLNRNSMFQFDSLFGINKKQKAAKRELKNERYAAKTEKQLSKSAAIRDRAQAKLSLANQGVDSGVGKTIATTVSGLASGLAGVANVVTGGGMRQVFQQPTRVADTDIQDTGRSLMQETISQQPQAGSAPVQSPADEMPAAVKKEKSLNITAVVTVVVVLLAVFFGSKLLKK